MTTSLKIKKDGLVPIVLDVEDGSTNLYVQAKIYDHLNVLLATVNLSHVATGLYTYQGYLMPDKEFIKVRFTIFTDNAYTIVDGTHGSDTDVFYLDTTSSSGGTGSSGDELIGVIDNDDLIGQIDSDDLVGGFDLEDDLIGQIEDAGDLIGEIEATELVGTLENC